MIDLFDYLDVINELDDDDDVFVKFNEVAQKKFGKTMDEINAEQEKYKETLEQKQKDDEDLRELQEQLANIQKQISEKLVIDTMVEKKGSGPISVSVYDSATDAVNTFKSVKEASAFIKRDPSGVSTRLSAAKKSGFKPQNTTYFVNYTEHFVKPVKL